jgi:hypothetical protein
MEAIIKNILELPVALKNRKTVINVIEMKVISINKETFAIAIYNDFVQM